MDLCYKGDQLQENSGTVHLKQCQGGQMCNGKLNRCMADPYQQFEGKLPGQHCEFNYQCASGSCILEGLNYVCSGVTEGASCSKDSECAVGLFCGLSGFCEQLKQQP
jgi:hypothetical protein